jgi:hypothetical protein
LLTKELDGVQPQASTGSFGGKLPFEELLCNIDWYGADIVDLEHDTFLR